ncbi:hypothetical protein GGR56DRAFT_676749 [Xylariaceae sp. FL0804]|nr:hypothetical protein GGR56DRAFT_676749 [Xylariaceae sp. FL0804]
MVIWKNMVWEPEGLGKNGIPSQIPPSPVSDQPMVELTAPPPADKFKILAPGPETSQADHGKLFLAFVSSDDPRTGQSWCPDVRAALPYLEAAFEAEDKPTLLIVEVGQRPEWKDPACVFRTKWNIHNVPTLVRYERLPGGELIERARLVEGDFPVVSSSRGRG